MSARDDTACPYCGARYRALRTRLTYRDVYELLWSPSPDPSQWRYKRRNTVLGLWHQLKLALWEEHLHGCAVEAGDETDGTDREYEYTDNEVPF